MGRIDEALREGSSFPKVWPDPLPEMTVPQQMAVATRLLARAGMALDVAGHITVMRDEHTMWATPYGKWWYEISASDILVVDFDGEVLEGSWDVTPAIFIHTELHRSRPDAKVVVHNHPHWATLAATMHLVPEITDQQACMFDGEVVLHDEFAGGVDDADAGQQLAEVAGDASVVLLAHEGVLVLGSTVPEATYKFETFERMCQLNLEAMMAGRPGTPVPPDRRKRLKEMLLRYSTQFYWNGTVRRLLADEPEVLA